MRHILTAAAVCGVGLAGIVLAQEQARERQRQQDGVQRQQERQAPRERRARPGVPERAEGETAFYRASELIGKKVQDAEGEALGEIKDLMIDGRTDEVRYLVLEADRALEVARGEYLVIPWVVTEVQAPPRVEETMVVLDIERARLAQAPALTEEQLQDPRALEWTGQVDQYFDVREAQRRRVLRPEQQPERPRLRQEREPGAAPEREPRRPRQPRQPREPQTDDTDG